MSRILKFRGWDTKNKTMYRNIGIDSNGKPMSLDIYYAGYNSAQFANYPSLDEILREIDEKTHIVVMQFTGLKDCNFQEVYESDIVNIRNWGRTDEVLAVAEIVWGEAGWDFEPFFDVDSYDKFRRIEVIGNKWENEDLLP